MGIPKFFKTIVDKYPSILKYNLSNNVDNLYLDMNCIIHPCCKKSHDKNPHNEDAMIDEVLEYTKYVIDFVNPQKRVYLAIDGVAPRSKMNQQRLRRFKSVLVEKQKSQVYEKYNQNKLESQKKEYITGWDSNAISPMTPFMSRLSDALESYFKSISKSYQVYLNDSSLVGEGEQKIIDWIRRNPDVHKETNVIYGLDADLIILGLTLHLNNFYLVRETPEFMFNRHNDSPFTYMGISHLSYYINVELNTPTQSFNRRKLINDFIVLSFLLGNDFLPHIFGLSIKTKGIDLLLQIYKKILMETKMHLIHHPSYQLNSDFIYHLLKEISLKENELKDEYIDHYLKFSSKQMKVEDEMQMLMKKNEFVSDIQDHLQLKENSKWKENFYRHYYQTKNPPLSEICFHYLYGLQWNATYYFQKVPSWKWYFPYQYAPALSDIVEYMSQSKFNFQRVAHPKDEPFHPLQQLLYILPPQSRKLLPEEVQGLMVDDDSPLKMYYPDEYIVDTYYHNMMWECIPLLPMVFTEHFEMVTKKYVEEHKNLYKVKQLTLIK
jgi:5'-3' exonuclease